MKIKKHTGVTAIILAIAMMLALWAVAGAADQYDDLGSSWAAEDIETLINAGIYDGMIFDDDASFRPEQPITRAEFLLIVFNAMGFDLNARDESLTAPFIDYDEAPEAYHPYISEGFKRGVLLGKAAPGGGLMSDWNSPLTRQEAATLIGRILNAFSEDELNYTDSGTVAAWAYGYIAALTAKGILGGMPDGSFAPLRYMTRAEASHFVLMLMESGLFVPTEMRVYAGSTDLGANDGERLSASFGTPYGLAVGSGNALLVVDKDANLLRRITQTDVTTIAGQTKNLDINGLPQSGYKDSVAAPEVMMRGPRYVCSGADGTIYYTDGGNNALRMILPDGNGYTMAGNGKAGYVNGAKEATEFNLPSGVAVGPDGSIYVADTLNNCIRKVTSSGTSSLFAGIPGDEGGYVDGGLLEARFCEPTDIQFGPDGALYIADTGNSMIRVISGGAVSTLAGAPTERDELSGAMMGGYLDGPAQDALFRGPLGLFVDASGVVLVADTENNVIRRIENGNVTTLAGNLAAGNSTGPALLSMLNSPADVAMIDGKVYVSDSFNHCIKVFGFALEDE
ncbi:MAG: S-layer homology domain-containing protein [Oscillospiraceae bacterium]|nr:S-layer homology domain-containing protein [Oscillospiraceae bacterium]